MAGAAENGGASDTSSSGGSTATIVALTGFFEVMLPPGCASLSKVRWTNRQARPVCLQLYSDHSALVCLACKTEHRRL